MEAGVLIIGSLLWENRSNALENEKGKQREKWRENLDIENKWKVPVPIRYGRKSSSRRCTYTMVFSTSVKELGSAYIIPYKSNFNDKISNLEKLKKSAYDLALAEGISKKKSEQLISTWGCIAISFNPKSEIDLIELKAYWGKLYENFSNKEFRLGEETPAISQNGELNFEIDFPDTIDYILTAVIAPNTDEYPSQQQIIEAIIETKPRYDTYVMENFNCGIRTAGDEEIILKLKSF